MKQARDVLSQLNRTDLPETLALEVGHIHLAVRCGREMAAELKPHLADALVPEAAREGTIAATVEVLEGETLSQEPDWIDWAREPGKRGRKDAYFDLEDGRLVRKVRTGMTFLQTPNTLLAFGPCFQNPNQVINFINTQVLNIAKRKGWEICHAAAVTDGKTGLAIAGLSGGGKSTAILRMLDIDTTRFVTNDRLMIKQEADRIVGLGIPKNPRINPGTILNNPRIKSIIPDERRKILAALPVEELWQLEEKHDLFVSDVFGPDRVQFTMPLTQFWVLNWSRTSEQKTEVSEVQIAERPDLLSAIMKSAGPFYQDRQGVFLSDTDPFEPGNYLKQLEKVQVFEVSGKIDFEAVTAAGRDLFV